MNLTFNDIVSYAVPVLFALLVHGLVVGLMMVNWEEPVRSYTEVQPYYIEATVVAENPYTAKAKRETERVQSRREQKLLERRKTEARLKREQAEWAKKQQAKAAVKPAEPVPVPIPEPEPVTREVEERTVDQDAARAEFADELAMALEREANARKAVTDDEKAMAFVAQIQREIGQNWSRPPSARNGMQALLRVRLIPTGEVVDVKVEESSGNDSFDRSAVLAVTKAQRFLVPSDSRRFERDFREFTVLFRPDDLRL